MGTPDFAVASLRRLVEDGHEVVGVFTQPDKPKNRGMKLTFSPVKEYALTQDLPVYQPLKMRDGEALGILRELAPELIVVAAYGKILPQEILDLPQYGCINVHSSLLPKYRGVLALTDLGRDRADDIARVERRNHIHDGNAGNALAVQDRPVDGRGAAVLRQKRGVNVDAAVLRQV